MLDTCEISHPHDPLIPRLEVLLTALFGDGSTFRQTRRAAPVRSRLFTIVEENGSMFGIACEKLFSSRSTLLYYLSAASLAHTLAQAGLSLSIGEERTWASAHRYEILHDGRPFELLVSTNDPAQPTAVRPVCAEHRALLGLSAHLQTTDNITSRRCHLSGALCAPAVGEGALDGVRVLIEAHESGGFLLRVEESMEAEELLFVEVSLGAISLSLTDLLTLRPGSTISIDAPELTGTILVNRADYAQVKIRREGSMLGLEITEISRSDLLELPRP